MHVTYFQMTLTLWGMIKIINHKLYKNVDIKRNGPNRIHDTNKLHSLAKWRVFGLVV